MIILRLNSIAFRGSDDHTVGYRKKVLEFLSTDKENDSQFDIIREMREGQFKWVADSTFPGALELMRKQIAAHLNTISWLKADLNDFYFDIEYENVENGMFWVPNVSDGRRYRVSDLKVW